MTGGEPGAMTPAPVIPDSVAGFLAACAATDADMVSFTLLCCRCASTQPERWPRATWRALMEGAGRDWRPADATLHVICAGCTGGTIWPASADALLREICSGGYTGGITWWPTSSGMTEEA